MNVSTSDHGIQIFSRIIRPEEGGMSAEAAQSILKFRLTEDDQKRVNELAAKARDGSLTHNERALLDDYDRIATLLEVMQSKARLSLKPDTRGNPTGDRQHGSW